MLLSAYLYSLYKDKNRQTPFEFFTNIKNKTMSALGATDNSSSQGSTTTTPSYVAPTTPPPKKKQEGLSWSNPEDRPIIVAMFIVIIFEFVVLYYAILMAMSVSKNKTQLFLNLVGAVFFTLPYIVLNVVLNTEAYKNITSDDYKMFSLNDSNSTTSKEGETKTLVGSVTSSVATPSTSSPITLADYSLTPSSSKNSLSTNSLSKKITPSSSKNSLSTNSLSKKITPSSSKMTSSSKKNMSSSKIPQKSSYKSKKFSTYV